VPPRDGLCCALCGLPIMVTGCDHVANNGKVVPMIQVMLNVEAAYFASLLPDNPVPIDWE